MNKFWTNILRYPRFFISSLIGLIIIILTPFQAFLKSKNLYLPVFILLFIFIIFSIYILKAMLAL